MAMSEVELKTLIKTALPDAEIEITDLRGDGDHYAARVISEQFIGKSRVQQHKMVYDAIKGGMGDALHALALQTGTPT
jgi:stress-induced morphogen